MSTTTIAKEQKPTRVSSGVAGLDDVLNGGWPENHLYLVEGDPGTGKTTFALRFLLDGEARGESGLYVTLSESKGELELVAESHGWEIGNLSIFEFAPTEESLRPENEYSALHPAEVEFQDTMQSILKKIEEIRPRRVVFDSLSEIRLLAGDALRYRRQVLALKHFFLNRRCTVLLLDDRTSGVRDLQLQSIAHGVLFLERLARDYGVERRRMRVMKLRGSRFREGFHDYSIDTGRIHVYPRLVASEHRLLGVAERCRCDIPGLDELWGGGVPQGTTTLITGPAGTGKSSIALAYAVAAAKQGEVAALFHFDETQGPLRARATALGMPLEPYLESGKLEIRQFDPAEISPGAFISHVRETVEKRHAKVVIIDSLNGFLNAMSGEQQLLLHMHELCAYLDQQGVTTFLVLVQSGIMGPHMAPPVDLSYLADNVLLLRYFEYAGEVRKAASVVKMRSGKHENQIRELQFNDGIHVGEPLRDFRGVLTGVPTYIGSPDNLEGATGEPAE